MQVHIKKLNKKSDVRGAFTEILRSEDTGVHPFGQISIMTAKPGQTKGGHYHTHKREWYFILKGSAKITLEDRLTHEHKTMRLTQKSLKVIEMPLGVAHSVTNLGNGELEVLIYISDPYFEKDADTFKV